MIVAGCILKIAQRIKKRPTDSNKKKKQKIEKRKLPMRCSKFSFGLLFIFFLFLDRWSLFHQLVTKGF
jgi:hypothetical protein